MAPAALAAERFDIRAAARPMPSPRFDAFDAFDLDVAHAVADEIRALRPDDARLPGLMMEVIARGCGLG